MVDAEKVVVCGRNGGAPNENVGEVGKWLREAGCPGQGPDVRAGPDVRGTSRMSGVPEPARTRCKRGLRGKNWVDFSDEIWGKVEEKLDPHVAQQIHGTNSTKSCQINRSQKNFGALFVGNFFEIGKNTTKTG